MNVSFAWTEDCGEKKSRSWNVPQGAQSIAAPTFSRGMRVRPRSGVEWRVGKEELLRREGRGRNVSWVGIQDGRAMMMLVISTADQLQPNVGWFALASGREVLDGWGRTLR